MVGGVGWGRTQEKLWPQMWRKGTQQPQGTEYAKVGCHSNPLTLPVVLRQKAGYLRRSFRQTLIFQCWGMWVLQARGLKSDFPSSPQYWCPSSTHSLLMNPLHREFLLPTLVYWLILFRLCHCHEILKAGYLRKKRHLCSSFWRFKDMTPSSSKSLIAMVSWWWHVWERDRSHGTERNLGLSFVTSSLEN